MLEQLTYVQIAERLNISSEGVRAMVKRNRLPRAHDKHGKTLVAIDLDELQHKPLPVWPPRRQPVNDVVATLNTRIEQLEAELAAEQQRLAGHRALAVCGKNPANVSRFVAGIWHVSRRVPITSSL